MYAPLTTSDAPANAVPQDRIWRYIAYYGMSEAAQRVTRLVTTVLLARLLTPVDLGVAAMAITCFELIRAGANASIGQAVIRASDAHLAGTCITARRLVWLLCGGLAILQATVGAAVAAWVGRPELAIMIACLAGVYLLMPTALIQMYLLQRANRHGAIATVATTQAVADNILTILLALAGCGAWAIVLPKLLTCPLWAICVRRAQSWSPDADAAAVPIRDILQYSLPVLGTEVLTAIRLQLDKVLVGAMLGVEALGIYYFVFNAGIGLSLSLTSALSNSLYPHFAVAAGNPHLLRARVNHSLSRKALPIAMIVLVQAALAPVYVPLLFGPKWTASAWLVAVLCASASTKLFADTGAQALRAAGATRVELQGTLLITLISLAALSLGLTRDLNTGVVALSATSGLLQLGFALMARGWVGAQAHEAGLKPFEASR